MEVWVALTWRLFLGRRPWAASDGKPISMASRPREQQVPAIRPAWMSYINSLMDLRSARRSASEVRNCLARHRQLRRAQNAPVMYSWTPE